MTKMAFLASAALPFASVTRPSSKTCRNRSKTFGEDGGWRIEE
jgi:hypothetical protein